MRRNMVCRACEELVGARGRRFACLVSTGSADLSAGCLIIIRYISLLRSPANMEVTKSVRNKTGQLVLFLNSPCLTRDLQNK